MPAVPSTRKLPQRAGQADRHHRRGRRARRHRADRGRRPVAALGQQVFVTNHPGAAGSIGMKVAGSSPPDGYTLLFALSSSFVALPEIAKDYPYDLVRDFVSIGFVCEQPMAIAVPPSLGVNTLGELIDYVKKRPGEINVAVLSRGGIPHLTSEWIKLAAGLDWTSINYPGTPAGLERRHGRAACR
jgi:tripartite-type tricarboxylate transporter receptor subunit TctC